MGEIVTTSYVSDEVRIFGEDNDYKAHPITVDVSMGPLLPGTPMGRITATGKYIKYLDGAVDGSGVFSGFLCNPVNPAAETRDITAAIWLTGYFDHTKVTALGFDAAALADRPGAFVFPGLNILVLPG